MMFKYTQNAMNYAYIAWAKDEIKMSPFRVLIRPALIFADKR